jgi:hypothetical protein
MPRSLIPFVAIERPACPKCKAPMMLVSIELDRANRNGKDPTFDAGFAVAGVGGNPEATGLLERSGHRYQSRLGPAR